MAFQKRYADLKPWDKLGISRRQYQASGPWKKAGIKRAVYEDILLSLPDEVLQGLKEEAEAERLVEMIFGSMDG